MIRTILSGLVRSVCLFGVIAGGARLTGGESFPPPGVIVATSPDPAVSWLGSPSIVILPDGDYVASHDFFGKQTPLERQSRIYGSSDRGTTWQLRAALENQTWSTLFVHRGDLYLLGIEKEYGNVHLRRSRDGGHTWTQPTDAKNGLLFIGQYHAAPVPVLSAQGRLWHAIEEYTGPDGSWSGTYFKSLVISADEQADDLLDAANWTKSNALTFDPTWVPGHRTGWLEGNVVEAPNGSLVNLMRVNAEIGKDTPYELPGASASIPRYEVAARIDISSDGKTVSFDPATGLFQFPGSQSKFTIRFDSQTQRYWSLAQKITAPHDGRSRLNRPGLQRNVVMLVSSPDLREWTEHGAVLRWKESVVLTTKDRVAFQYLDWQFDGDDLIAVSRTAWGEEAASFHNSNYVTFHRIRDFRTFTAKDAPPDLFSVGETATP